MDKETVDLSKIRGSLGGVALTGFRPIDSGELDTGGDGERRRDAVTKVGNGKQGNGKIGFAKTGSVKGGLNKAGMHRA